MKQVDFYLLANEVASGRLKFTSRLANKLQSLGQTTLIVVQDLQQLSELDQVLWSFSDTSFVAHDSAGAAQANYSRTNLSTAADVNADILERSYDVLLTLNDEVPVYSHHFSRIAEVVDANESAKQVARQRFKHYQTEGFELKIHNISL